jgi:hypothetical protein
MFIILLSLHLSLPHPLSLTVLPPSPSHEYGLLIKKLDLALFLVMLFSTTTNKKSSKLSSNNLKKITIHDWRHKIKFLEFNIDQGFNLANINNSFNIKITEHAVFSWIFDSSFVHREKTLLQLSLQSDPLM